MGLICMNKHTNQPLWIISLQYFIPMHFWLVLFGEWSLWTSRLQRRLFWRFIYPCVDLYLRRERNLLRYSEEENRLMFCLFFPSIPHDLVASFLKVWHDLSRKMAMDQVRVLSVSMNCVHFAASTVFQVLPNLSLCTCTELTCEQNT